TRQDRSSAKVALIALRPGSGMVPYAPNAAVKVPPAGGGAPAGLLDSQPSRPGSRTGTGRGLKSSCPLGGVWVRIPPRASPLETALTRAEHPSTRTEGQPARRCLTFL